MNRHLGVLFLSAALLAPAAMIAQEREHRAEEQNRNRYYDAQRHEYHEWTEAEQRAWRRYLEERHQRYHEWTRASKREQQAFWNWRHEHPEEARPPERR
jgi:Flp pilus assembly protein TadB